MGALKDKYYDFVLRDKKFSLVEQIVFTIFDDVSGRSGMLDGVDDEIQEEILQEWMDKINKLS